MKNEMNITTNQLDYQLDLERFRSEYTVLRMCPEDDKRPLVAYEYIRSLSAGLLRSVAVRIERPAKEFETWYYLMMLPQDENQVRAELDACSDGKIRISVANLEPNRSTEILVLNLLLNNIRLESMSERSNTCESKMYIIRSDNFRCRAAKGEIIVMEVTITRQGCFHAHTMTLSEYNPEYHKSPEKRPLYYYYVNHLEMSLVHELPVDWEEQYKAGYLHIYHKKNKFPNSRNVVNQYDVNMEREQCTKTDMLYKLMGLMRTAHSGIIKRLDFRKLVPDQLLRVKYENNAHQIYSAVLDGCSYGIDDTVNNEVTAQMVSEFNAEISTIYAPRVRKSNAKALMTYQLNDSAAVECLLKIVPPKPEKADMPDEYRNRDFPELKGEGKCIQHLVADEGLIGNMSAVANRIMKELSVKRMISTRQLPLCDAMKPFVGWTFATARQVEKGQYIGMTMFITEEGKLVFGRFDHPTDVPGPAGRQHSNLLSSIHEFQLTGSRTPPFYPSPEQYYIVTTNYNCYVIYTTDEQPLPEYEKFQLFKEVLDNRPTFTADMILEYLESEGVPPLTYEQEQWIRDKSVYTVEGVRNIGLNIGNEKSKCPCPVRKDIKPVLESMVADQPLINQVKNLQNVDYYFGGLVDIHSWTDDAGRLYYVSSEAPNCIHEVYKKKYAGLPHVRVVIPLSVKHPERREADYEAILHGLKLGFGKSNHGSVLPFPFKILDEMCELQCLKTFGFHWENMNKKNYKESKEKELDCLEELFSV